MTAQEYQGLIDDLRITMLRTELRQFSRDEDAHLEKEFTNYEQFYPSE